MKIYTDPDLPDVTVSWYQSDCGSAADAEVTLTGTDQPSIDTQRVACSELGVVFPNVPRQRFRVDGTLYDASGTGLNSAINEVDLRDGFGRDVTLYFGTFTNFRVEWTFDAGATCVSLGVPAVETDFTPPGMPVDLSYQSPCEPSMLMAAVQSGTYSVQLKALVGQQTVAVSQASAPLDIVSGTPTDLGIITLTPCGASCP
jgi:hypothetical protein